MDGVHGGAANSAAAAASVNSPPPFLSKTYDMVDDSSTNSVVSWSDNNNSFVVWNVPEFARDILPKYFKHNNFSSFVRQLNTYGFRKVDSDRWEFANEGFIRGQKQLLKSISRRKPAQLNGNQQPSLVQNSPAGTCIEVGKFGLEEEVERLKRDKNVLMQELVRLRQQQQATDSQLQNVGQRVQVMEQRQQQMMSFLAKAMQSPGFLAQIVQQQSDSNRHITGGNKKRRLHRQEDTLAAEHLHSAFDGRVIKYQPSMNEAAKALLHQILQMNASSRMESSINNPDAFLIDDVPSAIPLDSGNSCSRASGVTLSEVPPTSGPSYMGVQSEFPVNCMPNGISDLQSSSALLNDCVKTAEFPELNLDNCPDNVLDFGKVQGVENETSLLNPELTFMGPDVGDKGDIDMMSVVLDGTQSVEVEGGAFSPDPDGISRLPSINDVFWEQFLTASPLTGDTDEINSCTLGGGFTKDRESPSAKENGREKMDKIKHIDHLTQQMELLASETS